MYVCLRYLEILLSEVKVELIIFLLFVGINAKNDWKFSVRVLTDHFMGSSCLLY